MDAARLAFGMGARKPNSGPYLGLYSKRFIDPAIFLAPLVDFISLILLARPLPQLLPGKC